MFVLLIRCYAECTAHDDCPSHQACYQLRCINPCEGACGTGADCKVEDHKPICSCPKGYTGHPFESCRPFTKGIYFFISIQYLFIWFYLFKGIILDFNIF